MEPWIDLLVNIVYIKLCENDIRREENLCSEGDTCMWY
jgi:hypothetical protein